MADYTHDIFISVKSDDVFGEWVSNIFIPLFVTYVRQDIIAACKRQPSDIFYYRKNLKPGDEWPDDLKEAIRQSRVAVALCSPEYFYSDWCLTEFHTFWERGRQSSKRLLVPVSIHDGESFPDDVRTLQFESFCEYVIVGEGFKLTKKYSDFQELLKEFSKRVAELVFNAPPFEDWRLVERKAGGADPAIPQHTLSTK